jgi:hypothetical protein
MKQIALILATAVLLGSVREVLSAAPANDRFANRITITGTNVTVTGSNTNANKEAGEPAHAGNVGGKSVWWAWTAPTNGDVVISTDGSDFDTLLAVYTGATVSNLRAVATNDDHGVMVTSRVRFAATGGVQYQIAVDGFNDGTTVESGAVTLTLVFVSEPIPRPGNDNFTNRFALAGMSIVTNTSNAYATREDGEPLHAGNVGDTSVWWRWTAPVAGTYGISTAGSSFDTLLGLYSGSTLSNLIEIASNDDIDSANGVLTSSIIFDAAAGQLFQIAVDGYDGAAGSIQLQITTVAFLSSPTVRADGAFTFALHGVAGRTYDIQASTNLTAWVPVGTLVNSNTVTFFSDGDAVQFGRRFYRALLLLPPP